MSDDDAHDEPDALDDIVQKKLGILEEQPPGPLGELDARRIEYAEIKRSAARSAIGEADPNSEDARTDSGPKAHPRTLSGFESKWAAGYTKTAGRHIKADGLVSRGGFRRILPNDDDAQWVEHFKQEQVEELERIAREVLRGRTATVFERLVIAPLRGDTGSTVEDLARQFGVTTDRIHKIKYGARCRVSEELAVIRTGSPTMDSKKPPEFAVAVIQAAWANGQPCGVCGRVFSWRASQVCKAISNCALPGVQAECLSAQRRGREFKKLLVEASEKDRIWWEINGRAYNAREGAKWTARWKAERAEIRAILGLPDASEK